MLDRLIRMALANRASVLGAALLLLGFGIYTASRLPVEVLPDLTKPTVTIMTEAPGLAPEEVETLVTVPLENALNGVRGVTRLRSTSDVSLSLVFVEFDWGTDIERARQFVRDRLSGVGEILPEGVAPFMTPAASLMGEIMLVGLRCEDGSTTAAELRTVGDWQVRQRLLGISGVAEVLGMGGGVQQVQVLPDPDKMRANGVGIDDLREAVAGAAGNSAGGFLDSGSREVMVRHLAMTTDLDAIASTVVKQSGERVVKISDVAQVAWGTEPMRGDAAIDGTLGVILSVTKTPGFDTRRLTDAIEKELQDLRGQMPPGVELVSLFRQTDFIDNAVGNLWKAILEGAVMVVVVLLLFLLSARTTVITLTAIPLSFAISALVFKWFGISVNSMTLGGLAVAVGMVVDDAIVDVENVFRRLRENARLTEPKPKLEVIASASTEVRHSILYATVFIVLVFLPLLALSGVAGRMFAPIAIATITSMVASFVVSLTVVPVLCSLLLRPKAGKNTAMARWCGF